MAEIPRINFLKSIGTNLYLVLTMPFELCFQNANIFILSELQKNTWHYFCPDVVIENMYRSSSYWVRIIMCKWLLCTSYLSDPVARPGYVCRTPHGMPVSAVAPAVVSSILALLQGQEVLQKN